MKKASFLCISIVAVSMLNAQSQTLKNGILLPSKKGSKVLLPNAPKSIVPMQIPTSTIILVGGKMNPDKDGNILLPLPPNTDTKNDTYVTSPNYVDLSSSVGTITTDPKKGNYTKNVIQQNSNTGSLTDNTFAPLTGNSNNNYGSLLDNTSTNISNNSTKLVSQNNQFASLLEPLTTASPITTTTAPSNSKVITTQKLIETIDPALMHQSKATNQIVQNQATKTDNISMPRLASIDNRTANQISRFKMPELAPIDGIIDATKGGSTNKSLMPELASIEGETTQAANKSLMPELAPIEDENATKEVQQITELPKVKTNLRGFTMPTGTTLSSKNGRSFIFKPAVPVQESEIKKENTEEAVSTKPSAGGGMGMPALGPIVEESKNSSVIPELAPIENVSKPVKIIAMPALAPIKINIIHQKQPQQKVYYSSQNTQTKEQLLQAAKNHQHDPNNPCCKVQMYNPAAPAKKAVAKKPVYRKKRYYSQPQQEVVYIYEEPHQQQPTQKVETIVYVPTQQQSYQSKQQPKQVQQPQTVAVQQPQQKVIYRDYTNAYSKQQPQQNNNCNCPGSNQQTKNSSDGKKYYDANNYASGLNAGPTAGDYAATKSSNNVNIGYTFYLNPRGKYSVGLYNEYCTFLVSQNGELKEYKINADPNSYRPKLNYFGKPENVAGIPIEYNYNRTVHKIGNVKFEYDFEGFFKTVGSSNVFYTSRSSLAKVDDINVQYDANANVSSVDPNNGLIQFNPQ